MTDENKWIAYGGSYPGSLAAWFRLKVGTVTEPISSVATLYMTIAISNYMNLQLIT